MAERDRRSVPAVGSLLHLPEYVRMQDRFPRSLIADAVRERLAEERAGGAGENGSDRAEDVQRRLSAWIAPRLQPVINATGVVLHTNLGRAPLADSAVRRVAEVAGGYSNLEMDLATGRRGERHQIAAGLLCRLTGAESAMVVNNNAAAVMLALMALARRREVIVSRGELVEIGGSFRMPDVMRLSGARMVEVGTTNRTRTSDYAAAIGPSTAAILTVHRSNFVISGFTESPAPTELAALAGEHHLPLIQDLGSGALDQGQGGPTVQEALSSADLVTFSGDKLIGGPQAGIVVGRTEMMGRLLRHPLARVVRVDKLTLAALEATLIDGLLMRPNLVQEMIAATAEQLRPRAVALQQALEEVGVSSRLIAAGSVVGGGAMPGRELPSWVVAIDGPASRLAAALRAGRPPVVPRVEGGRCCVDVRTILPDQDETVREAIVGAVHAALGGSRGAAPCE